SSERRIRVEDLLAVTEEGAEARRLRPRVRAPGVVVTYTFRVDIFLSERHVEIEVELALRGGQPGERPAHAFLVCGELLDGRTGDRDEGRVARGEMHHSPIESLRDERAALAAGVPAGPEHEVVHDELLLPCEELRERALAGVALEDIRLLQLQQ